jgi:hypothetical protein
MPTGTTTTTPEAPRSGTLPASPSTHSHTRWTDKRGPVKATHVQPPLDLTRRPAPALLSVYTRVMGKHADLIPDAAGSAAFLGPQALTALSDQELARYASSLDPSDVSTASNAAWREVRAELAVRRRPARVKLLDEIQAAAAEAGIRDGAIAASKRDRAMGQVVAETLKTEPVSPTAPSVEPPPTRGNEMEVERHHSSIAQRLMTLSAALSLITGPIAAAQQVGALASPAGPQIVVVAQSSAGPAPNPMNTREALEAVLTGVPNARIAELLAAAGHGVSHSADRERLIGLVLHALKR